MSIGSEIGEDVNLVESPTRGRALLSKEAIPYLLATADALVIVLTSVGCGAAYQLWIGNSVPDLTPHFAVGLLASFIHILRMSGGGYYDFPDCAKPHVEVTEILVCWFTTGLLLAFFAFMLKVGVDYSRGAFSSFYFITPVGLLGVRKATKLFIPAALSRGMIGRRQVLLVGEANELAAMGPEDELSFFGGSQLKRFVLSRESDAKLREAADLQLLQSLARAVRRSNCGEVMLALPWSDSERIDFVKDQMRTLPVALRLLPDMRVRRLTNFAASPRQHVIAVEIQRAPLSGLERMVKRCLDVYLAGVALLLFSPVMVIAALAVKLDSAGPVIFRQHRRGFNGKQFVMFKFRTMVVQEDGPVVAQATRNDPRVTSIGKLLRSASIDELPQLWNVLKGDMSLIGPRPHALAHDDQFEKVVADYAFRHHVKPGITGWAQCNGARGATPTAEHIAERVKLDLWYINNWSLWLDIQILMKTFFEVLRKRNAY
jgi:Undecaprenyl-phosphate glucose phosphotransferase